MSPRTLCFPPGDREGVTPAIIWKNRTILGVGGSERPTWVLGFSSKQSQRQSSFDVLVPVDRWRYAGKELQENA